MGFAVWLDGDQAWAAGTYEYRSMGVAVIARSDLFRQRDFRRSRRLPHLPNSAFAGYFASLGQVNEHLKRRRAGAARNTNVHPSLE